MRNEIVKAITLCTFRRLDSLQEGKRKEQVPFMAAICKLALGLLRRNRVRSQLNAPPTRRVNECAEETVLALKPAGDSIFYCNIHGCKHIQPFCFMFYVLRYANTNQTVQRNLLHEFMHHFE